MRVVRDLRIAARALLRHKLRTALAVSGLAIGVAVTLVMVGIGEGARRGVLAQIEQLGSDMLVVSPAETVPVPGRERQARRATTLSLGDCEAIADECESVVRIAPSRSGTKRMKSGPFSTMATVLGTTADYEHIKNAPVLAGRYFTSDEAGSARRVAIVGATIVKNLFRNVDPIGRQFRVGHVPFRVIGVLAAKGTSLDGGGDADNQILVPIKTAMRRVFNVDYLDSIYVQTSGRHDLPLAEREIAALLSHRHDLVHLRRPDDFTIEDQARSLRAEMEAADLFTSMIAGVAGVSFFVGAIGILSIMLITIRERVGEIGLRIAVGARPRDILSQFLSESLLLGAFGAALGVVVGGATTYGIGELTEWSTHVSAEWWAASLVASLVVGVAAGVYPAIRAARLDPIRALRTQ
jgi:putative ABC transport system permease protein